MSLALRPFRTISRPARPLRTSGQAALDAAAATPPRSTALDETAAERLVKLVPADVVAIYIPALGLGRLTPWPHYALVVAIGATVLAPLLLLLDARATGERASPLQYIIRTLAFIAWAFLISEPLGEGAISPLVPALIALVLPVVGERVLRAAPTT